MTPIETAVQALISALQVFLVAAGSLATVLFLPPSTTFDAAFKNSNLTLSGGNLTVTSGADSASGFVVRSVTSHASGKYYFEMKSTAASNVGANGIGFVTGALNVAVDKDIGIDANGLGYYANGGIVINNITVATIQTYTLNDVIGVAVNRTNNLIWIRVNNGNWNNNPAANPATGANGISISSLIPAGTIFAAVSLRNSGDVTVANFGATPFANPPPAGFGNY